MARRKNLMLERLSCASGREIACSGLYLTAGLGVETVHSCICIFICAGDLVVRYLFAFEKTFVLRRRVGQA